jgi:hypothetical protein
MSMPKQGVMSISGVVPAMNAVPVHFCTLIPYSVSVMLQASTRNEAERSMLTSSSLKPFLHDTNSRPAKPACFWRGISEAAQVPKHSYGPKTEQEQHQGEDVGMHRGVVAHFGRAQQSGTARSSPG